MKKFIPLLLIAIVAVALSAAAGMAAMKEKQKPLAAKFTPLKGAAAAKVVKQIQDVLEKAAKGTNAVRGTGSVENEFVGKKNVKEFSFWIKKPGGLRLEFTAPDDIKGTLMVTDGKTFWNRIPAMNKTYRTDLKQDSFEEKKKPLQDELGLLSALVSTPLERKAFWAKFELIPLGEDKVEGRNCYVAEFRIKPDPKKKENKREEGMFNQYLWIEKTTGLTWQIELLVFGAPELVKMKTIELNPKLDDSLFTLDK
jgi:outer membrane lipoprotein-sorting protein